ncbi:hypothetical protein KUCAC02_019209 [Chaenocephalus aceratus]|uniref:Uncharacterized protein n=1 Tax=Chaenocephalus aceratus TaxID=36190 RepID=A0ACB9WB17_CHAAC|nr:hypothetical protein KUCAC02_019209 [Chaenocephalus aceratus]
MCVVAGSSARPPAGQPDRKESLCPPEEACSLQTVSLLQGRPGATYKAPAPCCFCRPSPEKEADLRGSSS